MLFVWRLRGPLKALVAYGAELLLDQPLVMKAASSSVTNILVLLDQ
jgi:hypothetical protein